MTASQPEPGGPSPEGSPPTVGARLDGLPWSRLHTTILCARGACWVFDSCAGRSSSSAVAPLCDAIRTPQ